MNGTTIVASLAATRLNIAMTIRPRYSIRYGHNDFRVFQLSLAGSASGGGDNDRNRHPFNGVSVWKTPEIN
jgi:hypothetical protein